MTANNSAQLVAPQGDAAGYDKKHQEKWLIYCPEIADDTLLYMITALESYSIRSYGGTWGSTPPGVTLKTRTPPRSLWPSTSR